MDNRVEERVFSPTSSSDTLSTSTNSPIHNGSRPAPANTKRLLASPSLGSPSTISSNGASVASNRGSISGSERSQSSSYRQVPNADVLCSERGSFCKGRRHSYKLDQLRAGVPPEPSNFVTGFFEQISFVRGCDLVIMIDFMNLVLSI